uniref:Uncharacterized protein n=1 Tax=Neobodo designis TaxID=312471 RepID=A0A7S1QXK6_NEODS
MPSPVRGGRKPTAAQMSEAVAQLQALIAANTELDPAARKEVAEQIDAVRELIDAPPVALSSGGLDELNAMNEADGAGPAGPDGTDPTIEAGFEPEERERLERQWMHLCWLARRDMCEEEMLVITEKTFRRLAHCYGLEPAQEEDAVRYWQYLVKCRQENQRIKSACDKSEAGSSKKPKERNAGDVVAASAQASQRSKALPSGIESGNYAPEVYSPTAALWAKKPEEKAASLRAGTHKAKSVSGKSASKSPRRDSDAGSLASPTSAAARRAGRLNGTDKVEGEAKTDTGDKTKGKGYGPGWRNPKGWSSRW